MKNLLFGLIATVLFSPAGNAQKYTQDDVRLLLAQGMSDFTSSLKPAFEKSENVEEFKQIVTGCWYSKLPNEGTNLLDAAYKLLADKTSEDQILKDYNGKEMAIAVLYIDALSKKGIKTDGSELFGGTTGDFNPYATLFTAKCRWYQIQCWLTEIFGEGGGQILLDAIVEGIKDVIRNL